MKKLIALTMLSALLLSACQGEDLQGSFGKPTKVWTMELAAASPSGTRTVSSSDEVLLFDLTLPQKNVLAVGSTFQVYFMTDSDLDPLADGTVVSLKADGSTIGTGTFTLVDPTIPSEGSALITTTSAVSLKAGKTMTFTVLADTATILAEDAGVDDNVSVSVEYNGKNITGNSLRY